jgi:hypothetical protein
MASAWLAVATVAPRTPLVDISTSKNKNRPTVGQGGNHPYTLFIRLSATNGRLVPSAEKIIAKKAHGLLGIHIGRDCNGDGQMCQARK